MASPELDFTGMSKSSWLYCRLILTPSPALLGLLIILYAFTTACMQYATQRGLVPSQADLSLSNFVAPLGTELVKRPAQNNTNRSSVFNISSGRRSQNILALFVQLSGQKPALRCRQCREGNGLWSECVVSTHPAAQNSTRGACANCYYHGRGSKCSFRQSACPGRLPLTDLSTQPLTV